MYASSGRVYASFAGTHDNFCRVYGDSWRVYASYRAVYGSSGRVYGSSSRVYADSSTMGGESGMNSRGFMTLYDITHAVDETIAPWPGDTPLLVTRNLRLRDGDSVNLSDVRLSVHLGTHADAPYHYNDAGATAERLDPGVYIGPCRVADVTGRDLITPADLDGLDFTGTPRLLLRTGGWPDRTRFPERVPVLAPETPGFLARRGVFLLGLDVPSVDAIDSKDLPNHHALGAHGIAILESLALDGVPPGRYELIALPLKLVGADGSPIRAILRSIESGN